MQTGRASDQQRASAFEDEMLVEDEERNAAEMVGMEMGEEDGVDRAAVDPGFLHRDERISVRRRRHGCRC